MPVHRIELELPRTDVQHTDVTINVWSDEELLRGKDFVRIATGASTA